MISGYLFIPKLKVLINKSDKRDKVLINKTLNTRQAFVYNVLKQNLSESPRTFLVQQTFTLDMKQNFPTIYNCV